MIMMFQYIFCNNISIYVAIVTFDYDKISIFILKRIDITGGMMYSCNGIE